MLISQGLIVSLLMVATIDFKFKYFLHFSASDNLKNSPRTHKVLIFSLKY